MLDDPSKRFELFEYWAGIEKEFQAKVTALKKSLAHPATGISVEARFGKILADYLPRRYVVAPGFSANAKGDRSPMMDLIISDCLHIPPLSVEPNFTVFTCESVAAAIEITSGPKGKVGKGGEAVSKLHADLRKLACVRKLGELRHYQSLVPVMENGELRLENVQIVADKPGPRSFLVTCGNEWSTAEAYERNLIAALKAVEAEQKAVWLHAAYSVKHGLLSFLPYTDFHCKWIANNALLEFILLINQTVTNFPTYQIDIRRYRQTSPRDGVEMGSPPTFVPSP